MIDLEKRNQEIPEEFKNIAKEFSEKGFITTSFDLKFIILIPV